MFSLDWALQLEEYMPRSCSNCFDNKTDPVLCPITQPGSEAKRPYIILESRWGPSSEFHHQHQCEDWTAESRPQYWLVVSSLDSTPDASHYPAGAGLHTTTHQSQQKGELHHTNCS